MSIIIFLVVIAVLVVPVIVIVSLVSLWAKVKDLTTRLDWMTYRLSQLESDRLAAAQRNRPAVPVEPEPTPVEPVVQPTPAEFISPLPEAAPAEQPAWPTLGAGREAVTEPPRVSGPPPPLAQPTPVLSSSSIESGSEVLAPSSPEAAEPPPIAWPTKRGLELNWEQFMGGKLFAWIGGFALFLAVAFFIKYSFDHNLISEELRAAAGFVVGIGLIVGGIIMKRRELAVTSQTLCATGVVILYAVTFACRTVYHFPAFGPFTTFFLMMLITAAAFGLAVQLDAMVVAILGLLGGFLTPILLSTGQDNPAGLFSYIALLDIGLIAMALRRRWHFLILLGAVGTVLMELAWWTQFFAPEKVFIAMAVLLGFNLLFLVTFVAGERLRQANDWLSAAAIGLPAMTLAFCFYLISLVELGARPGVIFTFVAGADLCLVALALIRSSLQPAHVLAGSVVFLLLASWTIHWLSAELLYWALGLYLGFAALHTYFPLVLARLHPKSEGLPWARLFPALGLFLMLIPIFKLEPVPFIIWPAVLLIDGLAIGLAVLTASAVSIGVALVLTVVATAGWLIQMPEDLTELPSLLAVIGGFAIFFYAGGLWAGRRIRATFPETGGAGSLLHQDLRSIFESRPAALAAEVPALSAILPFLLLLMATGRLPLANPTPVFGLGMLLAVLLLGLALFGKMDVLTPVSLGCVLALQYVWHNQHFSPQAPWTPWRGMRPSTRSTQPCLSFFTLASRSATCPGRCRPWPGPCISCCSTG